jgi:hypothetical protein
MPEDAIMRTHGLTAILTPLAAALTFLCCGPTNAAEVSIKAEMPAVKTSPVIYRMQTPRLGEKEVIGRCNRILEQSKLQGASPEQFKPAADRLAMSEKGIEVSMNQAGTEFFLSNFAALKLTGKTGRLPSDEEAIKLSREYLARTGLMPRNEGELKVGHVGGIMQMQSNGKEPEKKASVVYFHRELGGLRVANFGSSITLTFGDSEIPAGVQYHWREVAARERVSSRSLLGADRVNALIKEDVNRVFARNAVVVIDKIELVLHDNGGEYIQPAFRYSGMRLAERKGFDEMPVLGYVPALAKVYEPITHPAFSAEMKLPTTRSGRASQGETE